MDDSQDTNAAVAIRPVISPWIRALRRMMFVGVFLVVSTIGIALFTDYLWRTDLYGFKYAILVLYSVLFCLIAFLFCNGVFGFIALYLGGRQGQISAGMENKPPSASLPPTALLFPIYNEDVDRVLAGLKVTYHSLAKSGRLDAFHFFVLSDSNRATCWVEEEVAWFHLINELEDFDRIHYRHRPHNKAMKSGNISDFLEQWGKHYRYMIIFDADSVMTGETMVQLVELMEMHRQVGIIQTIPGMIRAETLFARSQQLVSRLYSRVFMAGMNFWQCGEGNFVGHNAIIRVEAFMKNCNLPHLPWREPFGGQIYSHDFVEAALMRKGGYEVWMAYDLEGSYEEGPPNLLESVTRHRRWCQGNLQHLWLLFTSELPLINRLHFLLGIMAYTNSLLWFLLLVLSTLVVIQFESSGLTLITVSGYIIDLPLAVHGALLFGVVLSMLLSVKFFGVLDLCLDRERRRDFGGGTRVIAGVLLETVLSIALAPLFMLWHALFVVTIPFGKGVAWLSRDRSPGQALSWKQSAKMNGWITLIGMAWAAVAYAYNLMFFYWMLLILIPLMLSIPLNVLFSSPAVGKLLRRHGILVTPEEVRPPAELLELAEIEREFIEKQSGNSQRGPLPRGEFTAELAVVDPFVNALHLTIQRSAKTTEAMSGAEEAIERMLASGPDKIGADVMYAILLDDKACWMAHRNLWRSPETKLAARWLDLMAAYASFRYSTIFPPRP